MNNKRSAERNPEENSCKRNRTEEIINCAICKEPKSTEPFTFLSCAHSFHDSCITPWLKRSRRCPLCRTVVREHDGLSCERDSYENDLSTESGSSEVYFSETENDFDLTDSSSSSLLLLSSDNDFNETLSSDTESDCDLTESSDTDLSENDSDDISFLGSSFETENEEE